MAKVLCYTSPARGHLYPTVPVLRELARRGHEVVVATLRDEVAKVSSPGVSARAIAAAVEDIALEDYDVPTPLHALDRAVRTFVARGGREVDDLNALVREEAPDLLLVDFNSWGAAAVAEASGRPWAMFMPYLLPWRLPGLPPFGPGLTVRDDALGRARDALLGAVIGKVYDRHLAALNAVRAEAGAPALAAVVDHGRAAPRVLSYTAEPFEYACAARPETVVMIGPPTWEPSGEAPPAWLAEEERPIVLVTCSTEYQADGEIVSATLEALAGEDVRVVATTAAIDPASFSAPPNAHVTRYVPHGPVLARAACVVCHGGMGITQKALAAGVPVCVVPFGRDQLEVARRVEAADAGTVLLRGRLSPGRLRAAVRGARARGEGASRVARAFAEAGGAARGVDVLEALLEA